MIPVFTRKQEMGLIVSLLSECCVRCKILLSIADQHVTQSNHQDLAERLAHLELLTRRINCSLAACVVALTAEPPA